MKLRFRLYVVPLTLLALAGAPRREAAAIHLARRDGAGPAVARTAQARRSRRRP